MPATRVLWSSRQGAHRHSKRRRRRRRRKRRKRCLSVLVTGGPASKQGAHVEPCVPEFKWSASIVSR